MNYYNAKDQCFVHFFSKALDQTTQVIINDAKLTKLLSNRSLLWLTLHKYTSDIVTSNIEYILQKNKRTDIPST